MERWRNDTDREHLGTKQPVAVRLSTINHTVTDLGLNQSFPGERSTNNLLSHGTGHDAE
jgi:hypothetical protein